MILEDSTKNTTLSLDRDDVAMRGTGYLFPQRGFLPRPRPRRNIGMSGFFDSMFSDTTTDISMPTGTNSTWSEILGGLTELWQFNRQADLQDQINQINLTRAQQGMSPIAFDTTNATSPQIRVVATTDQSTKNMLMIGSALLLGYFVFRELRRGRR